MKFQERIRFGEDFELDPRSFQLRRGGRAVKLERIPMEILIQLVERAGHLVTREEITERVWGKNVYLDSDNSLNSAIRKIRQALRDDPEQPRFVQTVVGRGYLFVASPLINSPGDAGITPSPSHTVEGYAPGRRIGDYRILELIGGGGMGLVYRAEDLKLGRQVAMKLLPAELMNDCGALERMQREARIASTVNHRNICPIYQLAQSDGQPFIVMPLLEGGTLRNWIELQKNRSAETCAREILGVAVQIIDGLKAAHETGIIHRDIKPANIFITSSGEVKILDFGIAKILNAVGTSADETGAHAGPKSNFAVTETAPSTGTPSYLSPEQVLGKSLDERSDIYSFGSVLYEMCTGHRAFDQDTVAATREAILNQQPPPVRALRPQLPGRLEEIVRRAMERDRDRRYQTAAEIGTDLSSLKAELDSRVAIPPESSQPRQVKRKFEFRTAAIALAAVLVLISAVAWNMVGTSRSQPYHDFTVRQITNTGRAEQAAISPDGKYVLQVQDENGMKSLRLRNVASGSDTEILAPEGARFRSLAFSPDGDYVYFRKTVNSIGSEWDEFRMPVLGGKPLPVLRDIDSDITFSPDGRRISYVRANDPDEGKYRIFTANLDGSNETVETVQNILGYGNDSYPPFDSWSPDSRHILYTFAKMADEPGVIRVLDLQDKHFDTLQHFPDLLTFDIHYLPGGKWILLANSTRAGESGSQISAFSLKDSKLHPVTRDANSYSSLSVSADGKMVAAVQTKSEPTIELLDVNAHGLTLRTDAIASGFENVHSFDWQDDSHLIASDGTWLARVDTATGKSTELLSESKGSIVALAHCSTGAILINLEFQTGAVSSEIWKVNGDGSNPVRLSDGSYDMSPACSADGKTAYYLDGMRRMKRVRLDGGKPETVSVAIPNLERILGTFSFSPDGSRMAALVDIVDYASNRAQARVAVFDLNGGFHVAPRLLTPAPGVNAGSLHSGGARFSADGNSILYVVRKNGVANLWTQPLDETPGHVITNYSSDTLSHFRLSPSGRTIAMRRVHTISDIVLLKDAANP